MYINEELKKAREDGDWDLIASIIVNYYFGETDHEFEGIIADELQKAYFKGCEN